MSTPLSRWQAGIEVTAGTEVDATRILYCVGTPPKEIRERFRPDEDRNSLIAHYTSLETAIRAEAALSESASFEDLAWWAQFALKGSVSGVQQAATAAYLYTFVPTPGSDDLDTMSLEGGDGISAFTMPYGMVNNFSLEGSAKGAVSMGVSVIGAQSDDGSFTAALSDRTRELIAFQKSSVYIDSAAGNIGNTQVTAQLQGFKFEVDNGIVQQHYGDGNLYPEGHARNKRFAMLSLTLAFKTLTEFQAYQAMTDRFVRLTLAGSNIETTYDKEVNIDVAGPWDSFDWNDDGPVRRLTLAAVSEYDATLGHDWQMTVQNDLVTLP